MRPRAAQTWRSRALAAGVAAGLLVASNAQAQPCENTNFAGVAVTNEVVVMATVSRLSERDRRLPYFGWFVPPWRLIHRDEEWRFRALPLSSQWPIESFRLNRSGASATVVFRGEGERQIDLTRDILELAPTGVAPPQPSIAGDAPTPCVLRGERRNRLHSSAKSFLAKRDRPAAGPAVSSTPAVLQWVHFTVASDPRLYAPILELAPLEAIVPEDFEIWDRLNEGDAKALRDRLGADRKTGADRSRALRTVYRRYREQRPTEPASVYVKTRSESGSWLHEYWFYYPFDEGGLDEHLHDSEHLFVEVDKLGGIVRRVVGAGHGMWAPNSEYGTFTPSAAEVRLPLHALVEQGKHATAPDIDWDGRFTHGIDDNLYREIGKVWGGRDATGNTDSAFRAFEAGMTAGRDPGRWVRPWWGNQTVLSSGPDPAAATPAAGEGAVLAASCDQAPGPPPVGWGRPSCYVLRRLPDVPDVQPHKCGDATQPCALSQIHQNTDYKKPQSVLKEGYYPSVSLHIGDGRPPNKKNKCETTSDAKSDCSTDSENSNKLLIGGAVEISALALRGKRLPISLARRSAKYTDRCWPPVQPKLTMRSVKPLSKYRRTAASTKADASRKNVWASGKASK